MRCQQASNRKYLARKTCPSMERVQPDRHPGSGHGGREEREPKYLQVRDCRGHRTLALEVPCTRLKRPPHPLNNEGRDEVAFTRRGKARLAGCTVFITGASRGIGKAIALKAAKDGANIVIAAKTTHVNPKLPGTIFTAAEEIEAAGGKALPCAVDVRDEQQISNAVEKAVEQFGGIDILVNNASAISLTNTLETPTKRVDLMMNVNTRGTFLTSKACIPYLKKSKIAHILNLSPPLNLNPLWFKQHCAYTIAKYGMSMCVLGMAEEFKGEIAVNALWPKTAIHTAAMDMLGGSGIESQCRKVDIIADAAYSIFKKPKTFTGNFIIDENILREEGVKNFDIYAIKPGHPLLPDFFLDEHPDTITKKMESHDAVPELKEEKSQSPPKPRSGAVAETFRIVKDSLSDDVVKATQAIYQFELSDLCYFVQAKMVEHGFLILKAKAGTSDMESPLIRQMW
ncbi:hydroxysteroid dehydrogenase-like protein 2 isoform X2 [Ursus maritimus]|uniref:Hydroxysteroid dehydrogenase-like protein 2 n=1 Tax=Ursus maritimus TaxID=29073 RepID=A0A8M1FYX2_URSMA|nr:hydroxysteroid dehydrogenase-like protein 2 isoform X2 [Ursus maritimus]